MRISRKGRSTARLLASHRVETQLPRDLPLVEYDAVLIERVLVNLLENAAKYTPAGTHVTISATAERRSLRIVVDDDGPGLSGDYDTPAKVERLFDKFTRGERETSRTGVGLGLAICRAIVEAHGGTIAVEARATHGLRFVVELPRSRPPKVDDDHEPVAPADVGSKVESPMEPS